MTLLSAADVDQALDELPGWGGDATDIRCRYTATDFPAAIALVDAVAVVAEEAGHHPDIDIRWREVLFVLATHSEGGVTAKDIALAGTDRRHRPRDGDRHLLNPGRDTPGVMTSGVRGASWCSPAEVTVAPSRSSPMDRPGPYGPAVRSAHRALA